jgi:3-oxoacyl-[acyl-carrier protein] reductase
MKALAGKVAVITGAGNSAGIGFASAKKMIKAGAKVVLTDIGGNFSSLKQRAQELVTLGGEALAIELDVTDSQQAKQLVEQILQRYQRIDIIFNNAGYAGGVGFFLDINEQQFSLSWQVNVMGIINLCQAVIPVMQAQGAGSIINNASLAGLGVVSDMSGYNTSKFAVVGLTKSLAAEFGKDNIRVNAVCPGMVWTDMGRLEVGLMREPRQSEQEVKSALSADVSLQQRWGKAEEIADAVVYLASEQSSYISGVALPVAGGLAPGL